MKEQTTSSAPMSFTKQGLVDWLTSKGAAAVMDTQTVAGLLNRDAQSVRRYAKRGALKCDMRLPNRAVYHIEDVAEFLLANPALCVFNHERLELTDETIELIRRIAFKNWPTLIEAMGADDLIAEAQVRFLETRRTASSENAIGGVIQNIFHTIYREYRRKIDTIPLNENRKADDTESNTGGDIETDIEDDERNIRTEARRLINELPLIYVKSFLRHCPKKI